MQTLFDLSAYQESAARIVANVFDVMTGYQVELTVDEYAPDTQMVTAAVFFAGTWRGAVLFECSQDQAFLLAARLMGIPRPASMDDDVRDALGEFVNMIGGNLKSVLPTGIGLSIPSVLNGSDYAYKICGDNLKERVPFYSEFGPFWVTLVQMVE